jgi:hypothetical protein
MLSDPSTSTQLLWEFFPVFDTGIRGSQISIKIMLRIKNRSVASHFQEEIGNSRCEYIQKENNPAQVTSPVKIAPERITALPDLMVL